jgi:TolB protein
MTRRILAVALCGLVAALPAASAPVPVDSSPRLLLAVVPAGEGTKVVVVSPSNGTVKDLTDGKAHDGDAVWSPDGERVAFISDRDGVANLYVMRADGKKVEQLTKEKVGCSTPRWSPDGKQIAFVTNMGKVEHVAVIDAGGGKIKELTKGHIACRQPAWSPDGKRLTYSQYGPALYDTCVVNADGSGAASLTNNGGGLDAAWSPDGKRIAITSVRQGPGFRLYVMDADGKNVLKLSDNANNVGNVFPAWSPDGKRIAFGDLIDGVLQLCVCDADGKNLKPLTKSGTNVFPRWSPDGKKLAFLRYEAKKQPTLWVTDADGTNQKPVLDDVRRGLTLPAEWKPK